MKMKVIQHICLLVSMAATMIFVACTSEDVPALNGDAAIVYPEIRIGVPEMTMTETSRASEPMSPDIEKYVKTMAVFEFDNEGLHENNALTYHFIDFIAGTVDGVKGVGDVTETLFGIVETTLKEIAFAPYDNGTICFVANVTQAQVKDFYEKYREPDQSTGRMTLDRFKTWALKFDYIQSTSDVYDETTAGHLMEMYMFGYYHGAIDPATSGAIDVDLGRLASRIDITVINDTGAEIDKRLGYHFDNVCDSAYFFPMKMGVPHYNKVGMTRTVICAGENPVEGDTHEFNLVPRTFPDKASHTRYFYVAAHSAKNYEDATKLHLFYDRLILNDNVTDDYNSVRVPLCNVHPSMAEDVVNGYSLSRNTRYHFTIRLKKRADAANESVVSRSMEYGEYPGEFIVYLP